MRSPSSEIAGTPMPGSGDVDIPQREVSHGHRKVESGGGPSLREACPGSESQPGSGERSRLQMSVDKGLDTAAPETIEPHRFRLVLGHVPTSVAVVAGVV